MHVSNICTTFAVQLRNKDTTVWKQQATNRRQYKRQQWRRKTLNRLIEKLHTCKGDLSKVEHYNKTLETNIKESNDKKRQT